MDRQAWRNLLCRASDDVVLCPAHRLRPCRHAEHPPVARAPNGPARFSNTRGACRPHGPVLVSAGRGPARDTGRYGPCSLNVARSVVCGACAGARKRGVEDGRKRGCGWGSRRHSELPPEMQTHQQGGLRVGTPTLANPANPPHPR